MACRTGHRLRALGRGSERQPPPPQVSCAWVSPSREAYLIHATIPVSSWQDSSDHQDQARMAGRASEGGTFLSCPFLVSQPFAPHPSSNGDLPASSLSPCCRGARAGSACRGRVGGRINL